MAEYGTSLGVFLLVGLTIGFMTWLGYHFTQLAVNVSKNVGAVIGAIVGILISLGFWFWMGQKLVEG